MYMLTAPASNLSAQKNGCMHRVNLTDTLKTEVGWQFPCCCCCLFVFLGGWGRETAKYHKFDETESLEFGKVEVNSSG